MREVKKSCTEKAITSDHHYLLTAALKIEFMKGNPKTKFYRHSKNFGTQKFKTELY